MSFLLIFSPHEIRSIQYNLLLASQAKTLELSYSFYSRLIQKPWTVGSSLWTFAFVLVVLVASLGNSIVLWIVLGIHFDFDIDSYSYLLIIFLLTAHREMWSITNYFLLNLTVADLLMATINCFPSFLFMRDR